MISASTPHRSKVDYVAEGCMDYGLINFSVLFAFFSFCFLVKFWNNIRGIRIIFISSGLLVLFRILPVPSKVGASVKKKEKKIVEMIEERGIEVDIM